MICNFTWYNLPNQIKNIIKPFENQLSKEAKNITWHNLPSKLNKLYKELVLIKPSCNLNPKFIWFTLNKKAEAICSLIDCINTLPLGRIDITSTNWGTLTTKGAWEAKFIADGATNAVITNFNLVSGRVQFDVITDATVLDLSSKNITVVNVISVPYLQILGLELNQIVTFNPTIALPTFLTTLGLELNQIVTFNPTIALPTSLISLVLTNNQIVTFNPTIALPTSLLSLGLELNQIVTFNPTIALPTSLQILGLELNQIVTFNPTIALPTSLQYLVLTNNQIVTFNPTIALPTSLTTLGLNSNQIVTFNPTIALPTSLTTLYLGNNQMTTLGYTQSEPWANAQPSFINLVTLTLNGNINSSATTNLRTILISKNCSVSS